MFLVQLAGFILGAGLGWLVAGVGLWLAFGAPTGDRSAVVFAPMLLAGPLGLLIGGFVGMKLAGKWLKSSSHRDAEHESNGKRD
jgi:hypothetical protein